MEECIGKGGSAWGGEEGRRGAMGMCWHESQVIRLNRGHMRDSTHQVCSSRSLNIVREDEEGYMEVRVT